MNRNSTDTPCCSFCGTTSMQRCTGIAHYVEDVYAVLYCHQCGIGMTWPQPDLATLERFYSPGEYRYEEGKRFIAPVEWLFEWQKKRSVRRVAGTVKAGSMLDIGCGSGYTASLFQQNGWSVTGVGFNNETACHARETYAIEVVTSISELQGPFDLILVNHVLEHCFDPEQLLHECDRLLSDGGRLVVAVPNYSSLQSRFGRECWFHTDLPIHLYHFTEQGLAELLVKSGYTIIEKSHADWAQNFYGWLQTMLNRAGVDHNALYDFLRMRKKGRAGFSGAVILSLLACSVLVPASLLGLLLERLFQTGGVIRFTARHKTAT